MKLIPVPVSDELYARLVEAAGGSHVAARMLLESAIERCIEAEWPRRRMAPAHAHNPAHQVHAFGWSWSRQR